MTRATIPDRCVTCSEPIRSSNVAAEDAPGTRRHGAHGMCVPCYERHRRVDGSRAAPPAAPVPWDLQVPGRWVLDGLCGQTDPETFFPDNGGASVVQTAAAKKVCAACPVLEECREWALRAREPHGVWGGLSELDRRAIHRKARAAA